MRKGLLSLPAPAFSIAYSLAPTAGILKKIWHMHASAFYSQPQPHTQKTLIHFTLILGANIKVLLPKLCKKSWVGWEEIRI